MRIGLSTRRARPVMAALLIAAPILAMPLAAFAGAIDQYYDRTFVLAAHERCGLFEPQVASALNASAWQARGAALRAGTAATQVGETARRARARAATTPCASSDLELVAGRVKTAFSGWSRTPRMSFPGDRAGWSADRAAYARPTWRLMQASATGASPVRFGVVGGIDRDDRMAAVVSWHGRPRPTAVRLVMRDAAVSPQPWLSHSLPPQAQRRVFWSSGVSAAETGLLADGRAEGQAWDFPADAARALANLDPREAFAVEFVFRDGSVATSLFEAGDFAAGRAFLAMGVV